MAENNDIANNNDEPENNTKENEKPGESNNNEKEKDSITDLPFIKILKKYVEVIKLFVYIGGGGLALYGIFATRGDLESMRCEIERGNQYDVLILNERLFNYDIKEAESKRNTILLECKTQANGCDPTQNIKINYLTNQIKNYELCQKQNYIVGIYILSCIKIDIMHQTGVFLY